MKYYYTDAQNKPTGPVELEQLKQLHAQGTLTPLSSVIPEGATQWTTLGAVLGLPPQPAAAAPATPAPASAPTAAAAATPAAATTPGAPAAAKPPAATGAPTAPTAIFEQVGTALGRGVEAFLALVRQLLSADFLTSSFALLTKVGHALVLVGAVLGLVYAIIQSIRSDSFSSFGIGIGLLAAIAVFQYIALRFFSANASLIRNNPSRIGSAAVLDCLGLVLIVAALAVFIVGNYNAIRAGGWAGCTLFLITLVATLICLATGGITLNPKLVTIRTEESSAGEEAIGLASFFIKTTLAVLPLYFALLALMGVVVIVLSLFTRGDGSSSLDMAIYMLVNSIELPFIGRAQAAGSGFGGMAMLALACLLPLFSYIGFLFYYLVLDLMRAVLDVPRKLDRLAR